MSLNCNELNLILSELDLQGSFIQEIVQPGFDTLAFRIIRHGELKNLLICTGASVCRMNFTSQKITKNTKPLRFHEFLRSRVQGMRINSCEQMGLDRIVKLDVSTWKEKLFIYIRLWSGAANVIVTDEEGTILDCMYRRPKKKEMSGEHFCPEGKVLSDEEKEELLKKFPPRDFSEIEGSYNEKVDAYYSEHASSLSRESLLLQAEKWYNVRHSKMEAALKRLLEKEKNFESSQKLRHTGDLILSFQQNISSDRTYLDCTDYESGEEVHILLDPKKSAQENASYYYEQYKKAQSGMEDLNHDINLAKKKLSQLEEMYQAMLAEKSVIKLEQLLRRDSTPKQKEEKTHPGLHYEVDGWTIIVGRTASENDDLLRHTVKGPDMWLHTRDYAGGYVFIKARKNKTVPLEILVLAGNLAVYHSKARQNGEADLYYTQVKYLRRAKNGPKGLVIPTQEKNLFIKLDQAKLRSLEE